MNLVVIFNHAFEQNIPVLRKIFSNRFDRVHFLSPFSKSSDDDVIPIYRGSFQHGSYICDYLSRVKVESKGWTLITHDDVLLNPKINQYNLLKELEVDAQHHDAFIPHIRIVSENIADWPWTLGSILKVVDEKNPIFGTGHSGLDFISSSLLGDEARKERLLKHTKKLESKFRVSGLEGRKISNFYRLKRRTQPASHSLTEAASDFLLGGRSGKERSITLPFPLLTSGSWADFLIVRNDCLEKYAHLVGILNASGLFTEISIATALAASANNLKTLKNHKPTFDWAFGKDRIKFKSHKERKAAFDSGTIAIHPVKLSKSDLSTIINA